MEMDKAVGVVVIMT